MENPKGLDDLLKKLKDFDKKLAKSITPDVDKLFKESARFSLIDFYNSYDPRYYQRTYNFLSVSDHAKTVCNSNYIVMKISSEYMSPYPGFWGDQLAAADAFDMFFKKGEHGHGRFLMHVSVPPYLQIYTDIQNGFGGRMNTVMNKAIEEIFR